MAAIAVRAITGIATREIGWAIGGTLWMQIACFAQHSTGWQAVIWGVWMLATIVAIIANRNAASSTPQPTHQQQQPTPQLTDLERYTQAYQDAMNLFHDAKAARSFAQHQLEHPPARPTAPRPNLRVRARCPYLRFIVIPWLTFTYDGVEIVRIGWFGRQDSILVKNIWDVELDGPIWARLRGTQRLHFRFKAIEAGKENSAITWRCVPIDFAERASYDAKHR